MIFLFYMAINLGPMLYLGAVAAKLLGGYRS